MDESTIKIIAAACCVLALFVRIPKVEIPIWKWILRGVGDAINGSLTSKIADLSDKIDEVDKLLNAHIKDQNEAEITACRQRILRFDDEVKRKEKHGEEHWDNIISDVDRYTTYCREHPEYCNTKAERAMRHLKDTYNELTTEDFL